MSQQEFEPQQQPDKEIYQPQYPYSWSDQEREGMPRDEPPGNYGEYQGQPGYQDDQVAQTQVPWWARPQPHQNGPFVFAVVVALAILIVFVLGALGIAGVVIGSLAHIVGILIGAICALIVFAALLVFLVLSLVWRALGKAFGPFGRSSRPTQRANRRS